MSNGRTPVYVEFRALSRKSAAVSTSVVPLSAFGFSADVLARARTAMITARNGGVMLSYDGTNPTASEGHLLPQDGTLSLEGQLNVQALRFIREDAAGATVTVTIEG